MKGKDRSQAVEDSKLADCPMCLRLGLLRLKLRPRCLNSKLRERGGLHGLAWRPRSCFGMSISPLQLSPEPVTALFVSFLLFFTLWIKRGLVTPFVY